MVLVAYASGIEGITRDFAVNLAPMRVNMVSPRSVSTKLFLSVPLKELSAELNKYMTQSLLGKIGTPDDDDAESCIYCIRSPFVKRTILDT